MNIYTIIILTNFFYIASTRALDEVASLFISVAVPTDSFLEFYTEMPTTPYEKLLDLDFEIAENTTVNPLDIQAPAENNQSDKRVQRKLRNKDAAHRHRIRRSKFIETMIEFAYPGHDTEKVFKNLKESVDYKVNFDEQTIDGKNRRKIQNRNSARRNRAKINGVMELLTSIYLKQSPYIQKVLHYKMNS